MKPACPLLLVLVLVPVLASPPCRAQDPVRFDITESYLKARSETLWYGLYLNKKKMGCVRWQLLRNEKASPPVWLMHIDSRMKLMAFGKEAETRETEAWTFDSRPPYRLKNAVRTYISDGRTLVTLSLTVADGKASAVIRESGATRTMDLGAFDMTLADAFAADVWIGKNPAVGDKITYRTLSLRTLKPRNESAELLGRETVMIHGIETVVSRVQIVPPEKGHEHMVRFDPLGRWLSASYAGDVESRLEPESFAKKITTCHDLYTRGTVRVDKALGVHPFHIHTLVLAVPSACAKAIPPAQQQSIKEERGQVLLHLGAGQGKAVKATAQEILAHLEETVRFPISHEKVKDLARKAVEGALTDQEKVARLVKFVFKYIKVKEYRFEPHSIFEIMELRRGDCSEHSHLFTALARCAGIPARVVNGLAYRGDKNLSFGGHAWNEVVVDGLWVQVDPTWNQTQVDATHILLRREDEALGWETLGNVTFRVVRVVKKGGQEAGGREQGK